MMCLQESQILRTEEWHSQSASQPTKREGVAASHDSQQQRFAPNSFPRRVTELVPETRCRTRARNEVPNSCHKRGVELVPETRCRTRATNEVSNSFQKRVAVLVAETSYRTRFRNELHQHHRQSAGGGRNRHPGCGRWRSRSYGGVRRAGMMDSGNSSIHWRRVASSA